VDLGRRIFRESSGTDENRNSARVVSIAHRQDCVPSLETREGSFLSAGKLSAGSIFGLPRVCHSVLPKGAYKIGVDGIENHPFHPEIEDDWLLVHPATHPKHPGLTAFFPKKGTGKRL
jgi:hypothetical protein